MHKDIQKYLKITRNKKLLEKVKTEFEKKRPIAHNWDHIYRDTLNAIWIGEQEKANMEIVFPAILLHDIGFLYNPDPTIHHILGAEKCFEWLEDWSAEEQEQISNCIRCHKGKTLDYNIEPKTLDEKVVCDADLLEKVGYIGVLSAIIVSKEFAQNWKPELDSLYVAMKFFDQKLSDMDIKFYTKTAKSMAEKRNQTIGKTFYKEALKELDKYFN